MGIVWNFAVGLLFGIGLIVSGMIDPAKVLNFLDVAGSWDPSLAFVMGGAIFVTAFGYWIAQRLLSKPLFGGFFHWPKASGIDAPLLIGAATFGLGWGLAGFCPGPAIVSLPLGAPATIAFVPAMVAGIWIATRAKS